MRLQVFIFLVAAISLCCCKGKTKSATSQVQNRFGSADSVNGKLVYTNFCKTCHGENAEGNAQLKVPALANADDWYLYRQLQNFKKGIRGYAKEDTLGLQMIAFAKTLKDSIEMINVVSYVKNKPRIKFTTSVGDKKKGENTYSGICGSCHGPAARGNEKLNAPKLSGLSDWYLRLQIHKFKNLQRGTHPEDKFGAQMTSMVSLLHNEEEINDVIAYILSAEKPN
jgi:cytochrome c553